MDKGERVHELRKALNLTLESFGERLGVAKTSISRIEKGVNNLTEQMAKAICREYNVSYDWLVYGEGEMFSSIPETMLDELCLQHGCDEMDRRLIETYLSLSPEDKQVIKDYLRKLNEGR